MLNVYEKFDRPESLDGYGDHYSFFKAAEDLVWELGDLTEEDKKVLASHINILQKDPKLAFYYAKNVIKGPWSSIGKQEDNIMKDAHYAYLYARYVMKHRWLEAEPGIKKSWYWDEYQEYFRVYE